MRVDNNIYRHKVYENFTSLNNAILQDENISFFAKGLLAYLISLPSDWNISVKVIAAKFKEKESKILAAFKELIEIGYCLRKPCFKHGRLYGQSYYITDSKGIFGEDQQPPEKTVPLKNSDTPKIQSSENTVPLKKGGAIQKNNISTKDIKDGNKEIKPVGSLFGEGEIETKMRGTSENKCLFKNSKYFDYDLFCEAFNSDYYIVVDLKYYYDALVDWSASGGNMKKDWIATARTWMRNDKQKNRLVVKDEYKQQSSADSLNYLKNFE